MEITVEMCVGGRDLTEPTISPDGALVAVVARWGGQAGILVVPVDGGPERIVTTAPDPAPGRGLGGGCLAWIPDGSAIVYAAHDGEIWMQPFPGGPARQVSDTGEDRRCEAPVVTPDGCTVLAVVDQAEIWQWSLVDDGETRRIDDGSADFVFDPYVTSCGTTVLWTAWNVPDMPWDAARVETLVLDTGERGSFAGSASVHQPRTLPDGRALGVRDDTGWLNVWLGDGPLVDEPFEHAGPTWGMGQRSYSASPDGSRVAFTRNEAGFGRLCVVETDTREVTEVARGVHGQLTWRGDRLVALRTGARTPTQVVSYDTATWDRRVLAIGPVAGWDAAELPEPEPMEIDHDGVVLHARWYRAGAGRTICWMHGGPTDQWQVDFRPRLAYWCSRGWDVLVPDPRGSTGHGRRYQQALRGEWGRLDVDDTAAILRSHQASGDGTPQRTVLMGSSSGGLTVLGLLARHPDLAAGGIALYPVADLAVLADESHRFEAHYTETLVGPPDDTDTYRSRSPVGYAHGIRGPLLVMHGDSDPVVPLSSTLELVDGIRTAGGDVDLVVYPDEGHGFRDPEHRHDEYRRTGEFLTRVIDGR
ncbi:S9 family peptidase [Ilumatobacter sp.]|uniref:S9 family peptidase n=1 Tax=Ilumatobacter sp. TaxID=1967498 RepID=UPI003AF9C578